MALRQKYAEVFDAEGNIKACGRACCKELIEACNKVEPEVSHGDLDTGIMDVEAIKRVAHAEGII